MRWGSWNSLDCFCPHDFLAPIELPSLHTADCLDPTWWCLLQLPCPHRTPLTLLTFLLLTPLAFTQRSQDPPEFLNLPLPLPPAPVVFTSLSRPHLTIDPMVLVPWPNFAFFTQDWFSSPKSFLLRPNPPAMLFTMSSSHVSILQKQCDFFLYRRLHSSYYVQINQGGPVVRCTAPRSRLASSDSEPLSNGGLERKQMEVKRESDEGGKL